MGRKADIYVVDVSLNSFLWSLFCMTDRLIHSMALIYLVTVSALVSE